MRGFKLDTNCTEAWYDQLKRLCFDFRPRGAGTRIFPRPKKQKGGVLRPEKMNDAFWGREGIFRLQRLGKFVGVHVSFFGVYIWGCIPSKKKRFITPLANLLLEGKKRGMPAFFCLLRLPPRLGSIWVGNVCLPAANELAKICIEVFFPYFLLPSN